MKLFALILLIASAGQLTAQRSEFVDYLLSLQYATEPLHEYIMNFFAQSRATLSTQLTELNDEGVREITQGLSAVINIRDRTDESIAEATTETNAACIADATENWASVLETVGDDIAACADQHVDPIYEQTEGFHIFIQQHNRMAFNVQNMVLNTFTELNPMTSADLITSAVEAEIDMIYEEFEGEVRPEIERRLLEISNLRQTVPTTIHACVDVGVVALNNAALAIVEAVSAC